MDDDIKQKILALLDQYRIMTVATLRPDGWPQATTVGYVNEGLTLYFLCGLDSQKARNLAQYDRISLTIDHDTADLMTPDEVRLFRVTPLVISVLDYTLGFGHVDHVVC